LGPFFFLSINGTILILLESIYMQAIKKILPILINRYFLVSVGFIVWMLFFDQRDYFQQKASAEELNKLETSAKYYNDEINNTKRQLDNLQNNGTSIEKFARERYFLKREGEEVYIFEDTSANKATTEVK
jgi:cell division protein DivIC